MRTANIFCNNDQKYRNNCVNIDISSQSKRDDVINLLPIAINDFFESEEFDSIIINDCINFFNIENQIDFLKTLTAKLCKNGIMAISFYDVEEIRENAQKAREQMEDRALKKVLKQIVDEEFEW